MDPINEAYKKTISPEQLDEAKKRQGISVTQLAKISKKLGSLSKADIKKNYNGLREGVTDLYDVNDVVYVDGGPGTQTPYFLGKIETTHGTKHPVKIWWHGTNDIQIVDENE